MGWLILVGYVVGYVVAIPLVGRALLDDIAGAHPDNTDYALAMVVGVLLALFWPLIWIGRLLFPTWKTLMTGEDDEC